MNKDVPQLECGQQLAGRGAECGIEWQPEFHMIQRGDYIKPGWWHWRCRRKDVAGNVAYGYVQADPLGQVVVPETFETDRL